MRVAHSKNKAMCIEVQGGCVSTRNTRGSSSDPGRVTNRKEGSEKQREVNGVEARKHMLN